MNEFSATLDEFFSGRCEFAQLESTLARLLRVDPTLATPALAELERHFGAGRLPAQLYAALKQQLIPSDDRTRLKPAVPHAPSQRDGPDSAPRSGARTGSTWSDPATWDANAAQSIGPGSALKGRFVLEEIVGRGGMGVVFRARDLRKEEAQDRDPFVAIKILNDDFRRHPESLKALQREARKAQTLAHPNIATVFDFDRDGAIVYIQMEFLDGEPLDKLTKRTGGLGYRAAYPLIAGAGRALSYAHGKGIVHSDFKPGNCFLTKGNVVKVFDFGIARAAKIPGAQNDDLTRFDAGTLGALTPAYASCEMLEGEEPDARDDIYALGCVAYELLTGRHPFDKRKATEARDAKLTVAPVKDLTQRQYRALQKALAFSREQRTPNVAEFLEQLGERKVNKAVVVSALAAAGALAVAGVAVLPGYLENRRVGELVDAFGSNDEARIAAAIEQYTALDPSLRVLVLESSRDPLIEHFRGIVAAAVNTSQGRYDYPRAEAALRTAQELIPDSAILSGLLSALESDKADLMLRMRTEFTEHLAAGRLLPAAGPSDDVYDVLAIVAAASPGDPLLDDPQLVHAYALQTTAALERGDLDTARALIDRGRAQAPDDAPLRDLEDRLTAAVAARTSAQVAASAPAAQAAPVSVDEQRAALAELLAEPRFDAAWEAAAREILTSLASSLPPGDSTVGTTETEIGELYTARAAEMRGRERLSEADRLLNVAHGFAPSLASLATERTALDAARERAAAANAERARAAAIEGRQQTFLAAATANQLARARETLAALRAEVPADDPFLTATAPAALAAMLERLARTALAEARLGDAETLAGEGLAAAPGNVALTSLLAEIRAAAAATARPVGQPCSVELAGFGARGSRGQCWDMVDAATQAPRLVVVPAGAEITAPFAIGRFEIAVGQWNAYCSASNECMPRDGNDTDPLADVSIDEARRYAAWLSARTGATYRLPTAAEWQYAAGAPRDGRNDDNCVVAAAGRGGMPRSVTQGQQNNWGLLNYQGNLQEWTDSGGTLEARGGNYGDPLEACSVERADVHGGTADAVTGFRLVRELSAR